MSPDGESPKEVGARALAALDAGEPLDELLMDAAAPLATERFITCMRAMEGVELGVDRDGLAWLDRFVIEELPGEDPQELQGFFADAGCFFGECILQEIGGRWTYMGQPAILLALPAGEIILVLPRARVERAFEEGVSYSLLALFDEFVAQRRSR